jgi:hypothetical protein
MGQVTAAEPIQRDVAWRVCKQLMAESDGQWWRRAAWRCWGCREFSRSDPALMRFARTPDNRGCRFVAERWEQAGRPLR